MLLGTRCPLEYELGALLMGHEASGFESVYSDNVWRVYGFLAYKVRDPDLAQDLTQATFERALRGWSRYDPQRASQATWLLVIARNLLIDFQRRDRFRLEELSEAVEPASSAGPEDRFTGSPELIDALAELGEREREVIALKFGGDLGGAEIARVLGISVANAQQILSRSVRRLRELLEPGTSHVSGERRIESPLEGVERA